MNGSRPVGFRAPVLRDASRSSIKTQLYRECQLTQRLDHITQRAIGGLARNQRDAIRKCVASIRILSVPKDAELIGGAEIRSDMFLAPEIEMPWESDKIERIMSMPNYATEPATGHSGLADQVLLERDSHGWKCLGYYIADTIIVFRRVQNTGLADVLFLRCMGHRNKMPIATVLNESTFAKVNGSGHIPE